ncbi:MAG: GrpB family protein [Solirubrobacterales bacterium]|nr:GrpB family protein [Solirubrobacterales bacterium]
MLRSTDITTFNDSPPPPGESPWVVGRDQTTELGLAPYDASWPARYEVLAGLIRSALGPAVLALDHVGSTSVPGLDAKPIIDVDLTVADGGAEPTYVPALEACGFQLVGREPWWYGHRLLHHFGPACNLHVWSPDCPESARHLIFRDWLRANPDECELYVRAKRAASEQTVTVGGDVEAYNAHKQAVIRQIYRRAFTALGLA